MTRRAGHDLATLGDPGHLAVRRIGVVFGVDRDDRRAAPVGREERRRKPRDAAPDVETVALEDCAKGEVGVLALAGRELFEELTVRKVADFPQMEEGGEVPGGQFLAGCHARAPAPGRLINSLENNKATSGADGSNFRQDS